MTKNKLVIVGNGFDLAHGLKTSYRDFLTWYLVSAFQEFVSKRTYTDLLINIENKYTGMISKYSGMPETIEEVFKYLDTNHYQSLSYNSKFFERLVEFHLGGKWVDIECFYFSELKRYFLNPDHEEGRKSILKLNAEFNYLISKLGEYIRTVNLGISSSNSLDIPSSRSKLKDLFNYPNDESLRFLNFNYTDTLTAKIGCYQKEIIHIHGQVSDIEHNPIIFGYGDESDSTYQQIEDSGENIFLEHIKSFGYFQTENYRRFLSFVDSEPFNAYILGHSCGVSDRVLLNQIFEHENCLKIEIFFHKKMDGSDNFKELTQEISRHFKSQNKSMMRRKVMDKNQYNFIPQAG